MKKLLLISLFLVPFIGLSQTYEIKQETKVEEFLTKESMDTINLKVATLAHPTDTIYYNLSIYTTIIIYPKKIITIKKETE